mmetsp:Transcript_60596/g.153986  ORF Transcript_60596/g.153986 Transcript_60596/m.153986 type:complete len:217 (-) Transcript_60596:1175-1825(-)
MDRPVDLPAVSPPPAQVEGAPPETATSPDGNNLKAKATDIRSTFASPMPTAFKYGMPVCFTVTFRFLKCALMSHAVTRSKSSLGLFGSPRLMCTFSFRKPKSEKLMSLISQSHPLSLPAILSMWIAGNIFKMKSRQMSLKWLTSSSRASALVRPRSALLKSSCAFRLCNFDKTDFSMSSLSRCCKILATDWFVFNSWYLSNIFSPWTTNTWAPFTM